MTLDELLNFVKTENETLNENYYNLEAKLKDTSKAKQNFLKVVNSDIKNMFDSINTTIEKINPKCSKELTYIFRYLSECAQNLQEYNDPNELVLDSNNNSNFQNYYFEEESSRIDKNKVSSYITQNYEKFKQQQTTDKVPLGHSHSQNSVHSNHEQFMTAKSSIIQNLASRTPSKLEPGAQSYKDMNHQQIKGTTQSNSKPQFNPNPLTGHLKNNNTNDRYVNKFIMNK